MARSTRTARLETRTARLKLAKDRRHAITIAQGLILVYRRGPASSTWYAKVKQRDGSADDHEDGNGVDLLTIAKLLGHADTRITAKHYAHLADKTLADAVAKLPSFGGQSRSNVSAS